MFAAQASAGAGQSSRCACFCALRCCRRAAPVRPPALHQGTFARAVAAKDADARVGGDAQGDFLQDGFVAVAEAGFLRDECRVGVVFGGLEGELVIGFGRRWRRGVEFFQRFQAALCLARFGRLGAEAVDVALQVGALPRLFLVLGVGLQALFVVLPFVIAVVARVALQLAVSIVENAGCRGRRGIRGRGR